MPVKLLTKSVGPWPMNTYVVVCEETRASAIIDPGADAMDIMGLAEGTRVVKILISHGHQDHIGALTEIKEATGAPVFLNPADGEAFDLTYDFPLEDGGLIEVGNLTLRAIHTPGHTPGITCIDLGDNRILVGDVIFVGGPGKTFSPGDFATTMKTMQDIVFTWPDMTVFYPGHGPCGRIGEERRTYNAFVLRGWSPELCGDVTWE